MKCRFCEFVAGGGNNQIQIKAHMRKEHPDEYREVCKYIAESWRVMGEKNRANNFLRHGKCSQQTNWGVLGKRI
jgi:hypothetical protein